mmetsp:Transcript_27060/g.61681  ORF Transcript_27060/g.61681 Transcript_27060/m.61681 type:complete len:205 (-) Transcript_27060:184-798(-)
MTRKAIPVQALHRHELPDSDERQRRHTLYEIVGRVRVVDSPVLEKLLRVAFLLDALGPLGRRVPDGCRGKEFPARTALSRLERWNRPAVWPAGDPRGRPPRPGCSQRDQEERKGDHACAPCSPLTRAAADTTVSLSRSIPPLAAPILLASSPLCGGRLRGSSFMPGAHPRRCELLKLEVRGRGNTWRTRRSATASRRTAVSAHV